MAALDNQFSLARYWEQGDAISHLVAYVLLVVLVSHNRKTDFLAMTVSGCGLASGILNLLVPSASLNRLAHAISVIAFVVLGYVMERKDREGSQR